MNYPSHLADRLKTPLQIGSLTVYSRVLQSPLSGVTDRIFRTLVRRYAPHSMLYTEMIHAGELHYGRGLHKVSELSGEEHPISVQLFDGRPDFMAEAAQRAVAEGAQTIDINMGCPVNKITRKGGGSALLREPDLAVAIVSRVVEAVAVPVTVKTRLGWSESEITILDFARRLEDAGIQLLTVHGRTRQQGYTGSADWEWIRRVKAALSIPVIANGDIVSVASALACLIQTGADGVMCSRGTLGYPFLVGEIDRFLKTGEPQPPATIAERLDCAQEHLLALVTQRGQAGLFQARKHLAWYCTGFPGAAELRQQFTQMESLEQGLGLLEQARQGVGDRE
jgi:nifR3 family TIM-barrel protein